MSAINTRPKSCQWNRARALAPLRASSMKRKPSPHRSARNSAAVRRLELTIKAGCSRSRALSSWRLVLLLNLILPLNRARLTIPRRSCRLSICTDQRSGMNRIYLNNALRPSPIQPDHSGKARCRSACTMPRAAGAPAAKRAAPTFEPDLTVKLANCWPSPTGPSRSKLQGCPSSPGCATGRGRSWRSAISDGPAWRQTQPSSTSG